MVVVPLQKAANDEPVPHAAEAHEVNWARIAAAGTLIASGALLLSGKRRAGMVAAATGTSLALLDQRETLRAWWNVLPDYLDDVQQVLGRAQCAVNDLAAQREKVQRILSR
jgi:hypothetical protein